MSGNRDGDINNSSLLSDRGPNTNLGHNSIILMIEAQALYINTLISKKAAKKQRSDLRIEPKSQVVQKYNNEIQERP